MENNKIRIAITQGDTNGVGFELIFKAFSEPEMLEICTPIIYGSPKVAAYHSKALQTQCQFSIINSAKDARDGRVNLLTCLDEEIKIEFGQVTEESTTAALAALDKALADGREGLYDALVCGPMSKEAIMVDGVRFSNVIDYIEKSIGESGKILPVYTNDAVRMVLATNASMKDVAGALSTDGIATKAKALHAALKRDFRLSNPRIAIMALNSVDSTEEKEIIAPAVDQLRAEGVQAFGPYHADTFFTTRGHEAFDGIVAMHREQGLLPARMLTDTECVIVLANAELVCTIPDAESQLTLAGKNEVDEAVMRNAIYAAIDIQRYRSEYDLPLENPLPKLYHERPDSGEKLRFSIPKKKEE